MKINGKELIEYKEFFSKFRLCKMIKDYYKIDCEEKLQELLSISKESNKYKTISSRIPKPKKPEKMLCGFNRENENAIKVYNKLNSMTPTKRLNYVIDAIKVYIYDGYDLDVAKLEAKVFCKSLIDTYSDLDNKESFAHNLYVVFEDCDKIELQMPDIINDEDKNIILTDEISDYLLDDDAIKAFLN